MSTASAPFPLFARVGVELEYMIVAEDGLGVLPVADELIRLMTGGPNSDVDRGSIAWSNELVLHVIELKTNGPAASLSGLAGEFQGEVCEINRRLRGLGGRLMPTAMHPWMDPLRETRLWPHDNSPIYEAFNRIFGCQGHGWSNLQSMHLNLPFANDEEFGRLHAAVRLILPLLPALAASSPVQDGQVTGNLDTRLAVYRVNSARVPSITGRVIPEAAFTQREYEERILQRIYRDLAPLDPEGILRDEFSNARGAIARFGRRSIEIRVIDIQECPGADLAIAAAVWAVLQGLVKERWSDLSRQKSFSAEFLEEMLLVAIRESHLAQVSDPAYLRAFGVTGKGPMTAGQLWRHLLGELTLPAAGDSGDWSNSLSVILDQGPLAWRITRAVGRAPGRQKLGEVYGRLCDCLAEGRMFEA